jgi:hypothetical protein
MTEQTATPPPAGERVYERCLCREAVECLRDMMLPRSEAARGHLRNSRIEFLKAVRTLIDERIEDLSAKGEPQGTKVNVE